MKNSSNAGGGRSYNPYGLNNSVTKPGRIRGWLVMAVLCIATAVIMGLLFRMVAMQPYVVTKGDVCVFVIQPTGLNGGEELPCGSRRTHFSVSEEMYHFR